MASINLSSCVADSCGGISAFLTTSYKCFPQKELRRIPGCNPLKRRKSEAENEGFSARATSEGRRRKRSAEEAESAESLLIGTRATDVGDRENHGKLACLLEKMGTKKRSYASTIIGEEARRVSGLSNSHIVGPGRSLLSELRHCEAPAWMRSSYGF